MQICPECGNQVRRDYPWCGNCGVRLAAGAPRPENRRSVTIVFSDLQGSTVLGEKLDPESLVEVLARYFDEMRLILESHGGTIEKIIGDAIFAVFGLAGASEDHALRAVRAAAECQSALATLNEHLNSRWGVRLVNRTGIATGEVVVATGGSGERLLIGDVVQLASKLEQSAPPTEVLIGEPTYRLVASQVTVVAVDGAPAYRLVTVSSAAGAEEHPADAAESGKSSICPNCGEQNPLAFRFCGSCGAALGAKRSRETRKTATIVFVDLQAATSDGEPLPDEPLKDLMTQAFALSRQAVEQHGGVVAKFIGDAVMAAFGLPTRHEDDALRAIRAVLDMKSGFTGLVESLARDRGIRLDVAIGVNTGEVVAGHASVGRSLAIGDAVNVAARLEQAARPGEVLIGRPTYVLLGDAVEAEEVEPLALKGKAQPVRAYRLAGLKSAATSRRAPEGVMVGRDAEMALLSGTFDRAVTERACRMAMLVGDAGVGKTRLTQEFLDSLGDRVRVVRGRCLSYGQGITFWPIVGVVRDAAGIEETDRPETAREKLLGLVGDAEVVDRVAAAVGLLDAQFQIAELFWGVRRLFEILAREQPLAVLFDDIHWAEPTFLDLIERLIATTRDAPVMLLCAARPELMERRAAWAEGVDATRIVLARLSDADAGRVIDNLLGHAGLPERARARVLGAAEGNPLFAEQLVSMLIDAGILRLVDGRWESRGDLSSIAIPPTIHALLAARLDQLPDGDRAVIESASVIGLAFAQAAVEAIVDDDVRGDVPTHLASLEQRQFVRRATVSGEEAYEHRFAHQMIRDATYAGILKRARARLHERFVAWADEADRAANRGTEYEEILGYHLEQARRYLAELGPLDEHGVALGIDASRRLGSAGRRALERGDMPATANLLRRAADALPDEHAGRPRLLFHSSRALWEMGEYEAATPVLESAIAGAAARKDTGLETTVHIALLMRKYYADPSKIDDRVEDRVREGIAVLERVGDEEGLAHAWLAMAGLRMMDNQWGAALQAIGRVIEHARRAGSRALELQAMSSLALCAEYAPTPIEEGIRICDDLIARSSGDRRLEAIVLRSRAHMHAMQGDFASARDEYRRARKTLEELGWTFLAALGSIVSGPIEMLAGDPAAAEAELRRDYETLDRLGERNYICTVAGFLAEALLLQGRDEDAGAFAAFSAEVAAPDDLATQVLWRGVSARLLARQGKFGDAERRAREAVELIRPADDPIDLANALSNLGEVLYTAGRRDEVAPAVAEALGLYEQKGNLVQAAAARKLLAESRDAQPPVGRPR